MLAQPLRSLSVRVVVNSKVQQAQISTFIEANGIEVVSVSGFEKLSSNENCDLVLVDLAGTSEAELVQLNMLMQKGACPILFDENIVIQGNNEAWCRNFIEKIYSEVNAGVDRPEEAAPAVSSPKVVASTQEDGAQNVGEHYQSNVPHEATTEEEKIWVLIGSLGGPTAINEFFEQLEGGAAATFFIYQHIAPDYLSLLANQLESATDLNISCIKEHNKIQPGNLYLLNNTQPFYIDEKNRVELESENAECAIDDTLIALANRYQKRLGVIVLSGIGSAVASGVVAVTHQGGTVLTQSADSCVVSSMPEGARRVCDVSFTGTPKELAEYVGKTL